MKKISMLILILIILIFASSCQKDSNKNDFDSDFDYIYVEKGFSYDVSKYKVSKDEVILPDLTGFNRAEIKYILDKLGLNYSFQAEKMYVNDTSEMNKFVRYGNNYQDGDKISKSKYLYIYTSPLELTHFVSDQVTIDFDYEGKSFVNDGVGQVSLIRCIDGDTAWFKDSTGEQIKLRFQCIDTPESTIDRDPWGKAASKYTAEKLQNAKVIVLERESNQVKDTYGRYLGYVWVDGVLLNLLLVEQAYTNAAASTNTKYSKYFIEAALHAKVTGRRFYGELDPGYDYDLKDFK